MLLKQIESIVLFVQDIDAAAFRAAGCHRNSFLFFAGSNEGRAVPVSS